MLSDSPVNMHTYPMNTRTKQFLSVAQVFGEVYGFGAMW